MALDETESDDGAAHRFWAFVVILAAARRQLGLPPLDLDDLVDFLIAVEAFEVAHAGGDA